MSDLMINEIENWKYDDDLYVETEATKQVLDSITTNKSVSVVGPSGIGKSALVKHVALQMERDEYTIFSISNADEMIELYRSDRKTLYIVDDMCGNFSADQGLIQKWQQSLKKVESILEKECCKLLLTCRLQVFYDTGFEKLQIFKKCIFDISSYDLALTPNDKNLMTERYFGQHASEALTHLGNYDFFPLLCKLYYLDKNNLCSTIQLEHFFNDPFSFYRQDLNKMFDYCDEGKYKWCALLLLVIFNNKLEEEILAGKIPKFQEILNVVSKAFYLDEKVTGSILKKQLETLKGTFVTNESGFYRTIHDKLFDFLAHYFGTEKQMIDVLITHGEVSFVRERFVVKERKIKGTIERDNYLIPVDKDKLTIYTARVFNDLLGSSNVIQYISGNSNFKNTKFHTMLLNYMKVLDQNKTAEVMKSSKSDALNKLFVMREVDIKHVEEKTMWYDKYQCYGIVIPDNHFQQYIEIWFDHLKTNNNVANFIQDCRLLWSVRFRTDLRTYMKQLKADKVGSVSQDFIHNMCVMTEHDIKDNAMNQYECFGFVIPPEVLQEFIRNRFSDLAESNDPVYFINNFRLLKNVTFRRTFGTYMRQLSNKTIVSLIQTVSRSFLNRMFVVSKDDIHDFAHERYESLGIVIPDGLLHKYIEKWFDNLQKYVSMENCRPLMNVSFRINLHTFLKQLETDKIYSLIHTASTDFLTKMFVTTEEDIDECATNPLQRFGIVIPGNLLQHYIEKWFQYLLTPRINVKVYINDSRPLLNVTFRNALRTYMRLFSKEKIASLIQIGSNDFLNSMFVMTRDDIRNNTENRYECFGFVISDGLLQQYLERWFDKLTNNYQVDNFVQNCRPLVNVTFRSALRAFMKQLNAEKITSLITKGNSDFFNRMFVMTENDITDKDENQFKCIGIVIPENLFNKYIERWFEELKKTNEFKTFLKNSRPLGNVTFRTIMHTSITKLNTNKVVSLIRAGTETFFNEMFVMTEDDINDKGSDHSYLFDRSNPYDFGMVIPDDMLNHYIERWFDYFTQSCSLFNESRPCKNHTFVTAVRNYMRQLTREKIASIFQTGNKDFLYNGFVMTANEIKENGSYIYEMFGIIVPSDMLERYIERWFYHFKEGSYIKKMTSESRLLSNVKFRTALHTYIKELNTEHIASLIRTGNQDLLYNAFVMSEDDINDKGEYVCELVGIVIPSELLNSFIERCFFHFKEGADMKQLTDKSRLFSNVIFLTAMRNYTIEFSSEKITSLIQTESKDFLNRMFVMTIDDIKDNAKYTYELFGIVIPNTLLQQYIERWFVLLTYVTQLAEFINNCRPLKNETFRIFLRTYTRQLRKDQIAHLIKNKNHDFVNEIFVMSADDIKENSKNLCESFGILIPDDLLQQYIESWFHYLLLTNRVNYFIKNCRPLRNVSFRNTLCTFLRELSRETISDLVHTNNADFISRMFVMSEDSISDTGANCFKCFGIVVPDDLLHVYIKKLLNNYHGSFGGKKWIYGRRHMMNLRFRTAVRVYLGQMSSHKITEILRRVGDTFFDTLNDMTIDDMNENDEITDDMLKYHNLMIERLIERLSKTDDVKGFIRGRGDLSRPIWGIDWRSRDRILNTLRTSLPFYTRQVSSAHISDLIRTGTNDFLDRLFVITKDEIEDTSQFECFGIVIPDHLLLKYIERWFCGLTETHTVQKYMNNNRPLRNATFRSAVRKYIRELSTKQVAYLIQYCSDDFFHSMFVMTDDDIVDNSEIRYECFGIVLPTDMVKQYVERLFNCLLHTNRVKEFMNKGRNLMNDTFLTALRSYIQQLDPGDTVLFIKNGSIDFLNTVFVMTEDDIKNNEANRCKCFGIIIPADMLQIFVERLFDHLTKSYKVKEFINDSRPLNNADFRTAMCTYLRQLKQEKILSLMQTVSGDFVIRMFVMTEDDIKINNKNIYECIGIVIPYDLLEHYIKCWLNHVTKTSQVKKFMKNSRTLLNVKFRTALRFYMKKLNNAEMDCLIQTVSEDFFEQLFVMTDNDLKDNDEHTDDLLHYYIERWFESLAKKMEVTEFMNESKHLINDTIRIALCSYMQQLSTEKITSLIHSTNNEFFNTMFVITKDEIKNYDEQQYMCFGIVIPDNLLQQYIDSWFERIIKVSSTMELKNYRPFMNVTFIIALRSYMRQLSGETVSYLLKTGSEQFFISMFVISGDDIKDIVDNSIYCVGIVIPDDLLEQYIERWFEECIAYINIFCIDKFLNSSRTLMNSRFCTALNLYLSQLSTQKISSLILTGSTILIQTIFVMTEDDININSEERLQRFGIAIPEDLLHQYIERLFEQITNSPWSTKIMSTSRPMMNSTFRIALQSYIIQLKPEKIACLIQDIDGDILNKCFVASEDDINIKSKNRQKCFGIVIPDDLLQQYIERWFKNLTKSNDTKVFIQNSRPLMNIKFLTALRTYIRQLSTLTIANLIRTKIAQSLETRFQKTFGYDDFVRRNQNDDFLDTMFVTNEKDTKDNADNRYECVGIVIPDGMLEHYIQNWLQRLTKTAQLTNFIDNSRPLMCDSFQTALRIYLRQLNNKTVASLIKNGSSDFLNRVFVMTEDDITSNDEKRCECFGIVIPDEMLQIYIKKWIAILTKSYQKNHFIKNNRPWRSFVFRNAVRTYMRHTNTDVIEDLMKINNEICNIMFVMTEDDFHDQADNRDDMLQFCIENWFESLTKTKCVTEIMNKSRNLMSNAFRIAQCSFIRQLHPEKIASLIQTVSEEFLNRLFVISEDDVKDNAENQYECFGIVLLDDMLQKYIKHWFDHLTKSDRVKEVINENRPLMHITFSTAMRIYMRQLTTKRIANLIHTGSRCFINTMFVMTEDDIKDNAEKQYECFGIVLPDDLLVQYIVKWFPRRYMTTCLKEYLNDNRLLVNDTFRVALRTVMNDSKISGIPSFINNTSIDILNIIFVFTDDDIKDNAEDRYECFGWAIPDSMLLQYIEKWVNCLKDTNSVMDYMNDNRPLLSTAFQTALRTYLKQLHTKEVMTLIENGSTDFLNKMFVMTEGDIQDKSDNLFECFGIVIPCHLLHLYIKKWIPCISGNFFSFRTKHLSVKIEMEANRPMKNFEFRTAICRYIRRLSTIQVTDMLNKENSDFLNEIFVMSDDDIEDIITKNGHEYIGIVIPDGLFHRYIKLWFNGLSKTFSIMEYMKINRPLMNLRCQTQLRIYIRKLDEKAIKTLIQTASTDFVNLMFVMTEDDIKDNAENRYEWFGIVIPECLLHQYIIRWFDDLTQTDSVKKCIDANRCVKNQTFRKILQTYIRQINEGTIISLIQTGSRDFVNTMFVTTENDIKDNAAVNQYESFGTVIPDSLLHQYIEKRFNSWTKTDTVKKCIDTCRVLMNVIGRKAMQNYIRQINEDKIRIIIHTGSRNFINTMFVMADDDIKDSTENRYECLGIVLPDSLLQQYIGRLFDDLTKADSVGKCMDTNRCFMHESFRKALTTYTKQLTRGQIGNLIRTGSRDFINTMFVLTENDIKENAENRHQCFGTIIPEGFLHQYIERWFDGMTKIDSTKQYIDTNRIFMNSKFQASLDLFISAINLERIQFFNRKGQIDYLNTRRDLIKYTSEIKS